MSLFDDASLAMIPSAYKDGKLYSIKPTDGSGDFTFSRGSNLAATRVDVNGLIEKGRENLLLQSNQFDTTWVQYQGASVTSGQAGYDSTNNAWKLNIVSSQMFSGLYQNISGSYVGTQSIYAKAGTLDHLGIINMGGVGFAAWFDLTNGTIGTQGGSNIDASIESVGNGWYRLSVTQSGAKSFFQIKPSDGENTPSGSDGYIYIQDAQLEQGLVATEYIETTTTTAQAGILEDMPRLDYSGGASCPSLLLEPQRTNLLEQAEYFGASYWSKGYVDVELADILSPDGFKNAYKITETSASGQHAINVFAASRPNLSAGSHTHSCFVKVNGVEDIVFYNNGSSGGAGVNIDLSDGTYSNLTGGATAASVEPYSNNWYRITLTFTAVVGNSSPSIYLRTTGSYTGDGVSGIYMYGMQTEVGSYPTSYIPTYGTSQTRSVDSCTATSVSDLIGQEQGTIFIDATLSNVLDSNLRGLIELNDGTTSNRFSIYRGGNTTNVTALVFKADAASASAISLSTGQTKIIIAYDEVSVRFYFNGVLIGTTTSASIPACNQIDLGIITNRADRVLGDVINQALVFPTALTDSECIALTTL